jgi:hypothetical protein
MTLGAALGGCTASAPQSQLWPGPDWQTATPVATTADTASEAPAAATPRDESPVKVPKERTRRGSGTPPDLLFDNREPTPTVVQPVAPPPVAPIDTGNPVLSPRDPNAPSSAQGYGYQRQGPVLQGPNGGVYTKTGPTYFGTGANSGQICHAVGTSLFCN